MLDTMPFLVPELCEAGCDASLASFPLDHGVKVVHFWHWYNPMMATAESARQGMQLNARLKHKQLWYWYELWWELHQDSLEKAFPDHYHIFVRECGAVNSQRFGTDLGSKFVPVFAGSGGSCIHIYGGLAW
mmetsp:Transcript_42458/g.137297  ORF Transcript_42458/g.137297 Transcript_42458/m.137297 type:complete len:131 (-) Transcript_42458:101-493(-)